MKPFKGPAKQQGFIGAALGALSGGMGLFAGAQPMMALNQARGDIQGLAGMQGPTGIGGNFGQISAGGQFQMDPSMMGAQQAIGGAIPGLMQGGLFQDPRFQQAFQGLDIAGAQQQAVGALQQQAGPTAFGQLGGLAQMLGGQVAGGPQDVSGGMMGNLFQQGMANQLAAGNQQQVFQDVLSRGRAAAAPEQARQQQALEQSLFSKGMLGAGSTATGEGFRGLFEAQGMQDIALQQQASQQALQQQQLMGQLGGQQIAQGAGFLGQGLGQFQQNIQNLQGIEQLGFGQNLQALQANQQAGLQRLQSAQGLFGQGADIFGQQFGLGLGGAEGLLGFGQFGLGAARSPQELQASLLQGSGAHAGALAGLGQQRGEAQGDFFGSLASGIGTLGGLFSDARLKDNIEFISTENGHNVYTWDWNAEADKIGASSSPNYGVLAQEVMDTNPDAVSVDKSGYYKVDYSQIGVV